MLGFGQRSASFLAAILITAGCASPGDRAAQVPPPTKPATLSEIVRPGTRCDYIERRQHVREDRRLIVTLGEVSETEFELATQRMASRPADRFRYFPYAAAGAPFRTLDGGSAEHRDSLFPKWLFQGQWQIGSQFEEHFETPPRTLGPRQTKLSSKVIGWERITVPAGTFHALKVRERLEIYEQTLQGTFSGRGRNLCWYSPDRGCMVKTEKEFSTYYHSSSAVSRELID